MLLITVFFWYIDSAGGLDYSLQQKCDFLKW